MFLHISPDQHRRYRSELASMHRLRHRIFLDELKWPLDPIQSINGMEYDQFDTPEARYIVRFNESGEVDACCRLLPTEGPYLLADIFPDLIESGAPPRRTDIWEVSRFAADNTTAPRNIVGQLVASMLEVGLQHGLNHYVSVSDIRIEPLLRRAGWEPRRMGHARSTTTDTVAAEIYEVSPLALARVRDKSRIGGPLLTSRYEPPTILIPKKDATYER